MIENRFALLYPLVKRAVMIGAWIIFVCCGIAVLGALVEAVAFRSLTVAETDEIFMQWLAVYAGASIAVKASGEVAVILLSLISPWCCRVLLGHSGNGFIRAFSLVCMWIAILICFEKASRWCIGTVYFPDTILFHLFLSFLCGCLIFTSAPFYRAASVRLRCCLYASGVLIVLTAVLDTPDTWLLHEVSALLMGITMAYPAWLLGRTAPLIISMPSEED